MGNAMKQETTFEAVKAAPAIAGATYSTLTLNEWVAAITIVYIAVQLVVLIHKHYYFVKEKKSQE